jgi:hypothetical protein
MAAPVPSQGSKYQQRLQALKEDDQALTPEYRALLQIKQSFFSGVVYHSADALLAAALRDGPAQDFVRYFLALRANKATRLTFQDFCDLVNNDGAGNHAWKALKGRLWAVYNAETRMSSPTISFLNTENNLFLEPS